MDEDKIVDVMAQAAYERKRETKQFGLPWAQVVPAARETQIDANHAAWNAAKAALAQAGMVIVPQQGPRQKETFAEEVARLQREIGQRQWRLQYLVCGDPSVGVAVSDAAAVERR